jgi:hypothetical protein
VDHAVGRSVEADPFEEVEMAASSATHRRSASRGEIRALVGDIEAAKLEAILATDATPAEVEEQALAWGRERHRRDG